MAFPPILWAQNAVQFLKDKLSFNISDITIEVGALDPTITPVDAQEGSSYQSSLTKKLYIKQDNGSSTNWTAQDDSGITALTGEVTASGPGSVAATVKSNLKVQGPGIFLDGAGATITAASYGSIPIPYSCTITGVTIVADQSGSIVVDIKKSTYASFPTTSSICASAKPTLSAAQKSTDTTLTGWTTTITAGDVLEWVVNSATDVQKVSVILTVIKT